MQLEFEFLWCHLCCNFFLPQVSQIEDHKYHNFFWATCVLFFIKNLSNKRRGAPRLYFRNNFPIVQIKNRTSATIKYNATAITTTYPIWEKISCQGVLWMTTANTFIKKATTKQTIRICSSFFLFFPVIIISFIFKLTSFELTS